MQVCSASQIMLDLYNSQYFEYVILSGLLLTDQTAGLNFVFRHFLLRLVALRSQWFCDTRPLPGLSSGALQSNLWVLVVFLDLHITFSLFASTRRSTRVKEMMTTTTTTSFEVVENSKRT